MDLIELLRILDSSVCDRIVANGGGDFSIDYINEWINNSDTNVTCVVNNNRTIENLHHIVLIPEDNTINVYVWHKVGEVFNFLVFSLDEISDLELS